MLAAGAGNTDTVRMLLDHGARPDRLDGFQRCALLYAIRQAHAGVVQLLLDADADVHAGSPSPVQTARSLGLVGLLRFMQVPERDAFEERSSDDGVGGTDPADGEDSGVEF